MKEKKYLIEVIKYIKLPLTLFLLYLVFSKINFSDFIAIIKKLDASLFFILITFSLLKIFLQFANWQVFLKSFSNNIGLKESLFAFFSGISFRVVTPAGVGVYGRMMMLKTKKRNSFLAVSYEKLVQSWAIIIYAMLALVLNHHNFIYVFLLIFLGSIPLCLPFIPPNSKLGKFFPENRFLIFNNIFFQLSINLITVYQYFLFISFFTRFIFIEALQTVPIVQFANLIPITISGLGLREQIAVNIYPSMGISQELAVSCSLFIFTISNLLPAFIGVFFLIFKKSCQKR